MEFYSVDIKSDSNNRFLAYFSVSLDGTKVPRRGEGQQKSTSLPMTELSEHPSLPVTSWDIRPHYNH